MSFYGKSAPDIGGSGGGGGAVWGSITGTLSNQTDLQNALNAKITQNAWTAFTPTGTWIANSTYTGFYKRVGDQLYVQIKIALAGAPTSADLNVNLPGGFTIDTNKTFAVGDDGPIYFGLATLADTGVNSYTGGVGYWTTTSMVIQVWGNGTFSHKVDATHPFTFGNTDTVWINFSVPVL